MVRCQLILLVIGIQPFLSLANNLQFGSARRQGSSIELNVAWENAWNIPNGSHDAVWVFVKGKRESGQWEHVQLSTSSNEHIANAPLTVVAADDGKGVFVRFQEENYGAVAPTTISIRVSQELTQYSQLRIFGIEMVYIPQGPFFLGDGVSISSLGCQQGAPYRVTSEVQIEQGTIALVNPNTYFDPPALSGNIPAGFPKGFKPFYIMKYEISQVQYADFLNTLSFAQQQNRTWRSPGLPAGSYTMVNPNAPDSLHRNAIVIAQPGISNAQPAAYAVNANGNGLFNEPADGHHRAANFLSWADLAAYLDWAALRPITEMEYEKACRGFANAVAGEFAWGTPLVVNANSPLNDGTNFETVVEASAGQHGIANHGTIVATQGWGLRGPLRTGFAAVEGSTRIAAGASYFGVMELSGNVWEMAIAANGEGLLFTGLTGDGSVNANGNANVPGWCNPETAAGVIVRGGGWGSIVSDAGSWRDLAVSDRYYSHLKPSMRRNTFGGRGGR